MTPGSVCRLESVVYEHFSDFSPEKEVFTIYTTA